jgi:hypothetical protein
MVTFHNAGDNGQPIGNPSPAAGGGKRPPFSWATRTMALVVWQPTVRLAVVGGGIDSDGQVWHAFHAVVACQTVLQHRYRIRGHERDPGGGHEELVASGWRFVGEEVSSEPLIVIEGEGLMTMTEAYEGMDCLYRVVETDWPAEEDEARLGEVIAELQASYRQLYRPHAVEG